MSDIGGMLGLGTISFKGLKIGNGDDEEESSAMELVAANEDLLILILLFLPPKSLLRFKSVSKAWLSLISSSRFRLLKSKRFGKNISGLIQRRPLSYQEYDFIPLEENTNPAPFEIKFDFVDGESDGLMVHQSCNGLLLCETLRGYEVADCKYYVVNPTTKEYYTAFSGDDISGTDRFKVCQVHLAFDPRKSIHFKLVCIYASRDEHGNYEVELRVYSSETGRMTRVADVADISKNTLVGGVYWNNAINWIEALQDSGCYFNVDEERVGILPMPHIPRTDCRDWDEQVMGRWIRYFGESNDHLYLICTESALVTEFSVYEMDRGYSGWTLKFRVDVLPVFRSFPRAVSSWYYGRFGYEILGVVDKDDAGLFLVLLIPGKGIRLNLKDMSFSRMFDYATGDGLGPFVPYRCESFQFIESFHQL